MAKSRQIPWQGCPAPSAGQPALPWSESSWAAVRGMAWSSSRAGTMSSLVSPRVNPGPGAPGSLENIGSLERRMQLPALIRRILVWDPEGVSEKQEPLEL